MATYMAVLMHGERGGEGRYAFEGPDDLLAQPTVEVGVHFLKWLGEHNPSLGQIGYELTASLKNRHETIVTCIGSLTFHDDDVQPFMCMISAKPEAD